MLKKFLLAVGMIGMSSFVMVGMEMNTNPNEQKNREDCCLKLIKQAKNKIQEWN